MLTAYKMATNSMAYLLLRFLKNDYSIGASEATIAETPWISFEERIRMWL